LCDNLHRFHSILGFFVTLLVIDLILIFLFFLLIACYLRRRWRRDASGCTYVAARQEEPYLPSRPIAHQEMTSFSRGGERDARSEDRTNPRYESDPPRRYEERPASRFEMMQEAPRLYPSAGLSQPGPSSSRPF